MKKQEKNISQHFFTSILMVGLIIGFLSATITTPFVSEQNTSETIEQSTDNSPEEKESASITSFEAITTSLHLDLTKSFFIIEELPSTEEAREDTSDDDQQVFSPNKALQILFRRIISPNAP